jgi:hypothetical protein
MTVCSQHALFTTHRATTTCNSINSIFETEPITQSQGVLNQRMKRPALTRLFAISLCFGLLSCREVTLLDRAYQRLSIDNFSAPLRSRLPNREKSPNSMTLRASGTISQPVFLAVYYLKAGQPTYPALQDTLAAGTYTGWQVRQDFYSREEVELQVTGAPGATGSLTLEWSCQ